MAVVTGAMGSLLPKLAELLKDEYNLQKNVKKHVESLSKEMESMNAALRKVAEVPREQLDEQVKIWANEVRELSYKMEDVVDTFLVRVEGHEAKPNSNKLKRLVKRMGNVFTHGKARHQIAGAIKDINMEVKEVAARRDRNKIDGIVANPPAATTIDPRLHAMYIDTTKLVGIYGKRDQELMRLLAMEDDSISAKRLKIVSIVGFGGLGKTTLARAVYDKIKGDFDCKAFVPVGRNPDLKKVFRDILIDLDKSSSDLPMLDERQLINRIRLFLDDKRYLIIIDDIWDEKLWEGINLAFSNRNNLGSRLITTTRKVSVSTTCCSSADDSIYHMKPLSADDSKMLFHKRIFHDCCPAEFEDVSSDILKKCGGVPLAIITIASLLASSGQHIKPVHEWHALLQSLGLGLTEDASLEEMQRILSFSYYDLPSHLKTCLLYICIYPEDSYIEKDRLIWKWVTESFVQPGKPGLSLFVIGENYFSELINRSMIQPIYNYIGLVEGCRVHDMVLDLICSLSREEFFVNLLDGSSEGTSCPSNIRWLSLQHGQDHEAKSLINSMRISQVRSVTIFPPAIDIMPALSRFDVLRVLDFAGCDIGESSWKLKGVGNLFHLRYLGLARTGIRELPAEIGNLQFLHVLDLKDNCLEKIPLTVCKLRRLMFLGFNYGCEMPPGVLGNLTSIEVLKTIEASLDIVQQLSSLARLRELDIRFPDKSFDLYGPFVESLCNLKHLESLFIYYYSDPSPGLMDLLEEHSWVPPLSLRKFYSYIPSNLSTLPAWIKRDPSRLSSLSELDLKLKGVQQEDMQILAGLPALRRLEIVSTHQTQRRLVISADGYRRVVCFELECGSGAQIMFEPGALPRAETVYFSVGVRVAKDDGDGKFELGLKGNLLSLRRTDVSIHRDGATVGEAREAEAAVRRALQDHPNRPVVSIGMEPGIPEGARDDDLCESDGMSSSASATPSETGSEDDEGLQPMEEVQSSVHL